MKKNIILLLFLTLFLTSCFWNSTPWETQNVDDIKNELLNTWTTEVSTWEINTFTWTEISTWVTSEEDNKLYKISYSTDEKFLELDSLDWKELKYWEIELTWKTLEKVDKIVVNFSNKDSKFPNDEFPLKKFKAWDETFKYYASSKYKVLDYGENNYEFVAYSWDKISKLNLTINIEKKETEKINTVQKTLSWSSAEWNIWTIWETTSIETKNEISSWATTTCENLLDHLSETQNTWFYWNTCRPTKDWLSFYLTKLNWKNYIYEKHTIDTTTWTEKTYELEIWTWDTETKDTIKDTNNKLKLRNSDFKISEE